MLYVLDPTDAARAARGKRVGIEEREDGSLSFWHGEHELLATAFPKDHGVQQGEVVENKHFYFGEDRTPVLWADILRTQLEVPMSCPRSSCPTPCWSWRARTTRSAAARSRP